MAADECYEISDASPNYPAGRWWVEYVGLKDDKLFVCFRNGDCAVYQTTLAEAQQHLANILATNHPGRYVNFALAFLDKPYVKAACPAGLILSNILTLGSDCDGSPEFNLATTYTFTPLAVTGWFRVFLPSTLGQNFTATWTDPNVPAGFISFATNILDNGCAGALLVGSSNSGTFSGTALGVLGEVFIQYPGFIGTGTPVTFSIARV